MLEAISIGCPFDCGGSCSLRAYVRDGVVLRIGPDEAGEDTPERPQLRPCARGLAAVQRVYSPERLLYPLKRTGERGSGSFARVSWEEALDEVAGQLRRVAEAHGPAAILNLSGSGNSDGRLHQTGAAIGRLLNMLGGQTVSSHIVSFEGALFASRQTYGAVALEDERTELVKSKLIIAWGCNPAESIAATNTSWYLARAKENGARFVFVDPLLSESAAALADLWIPIRPATDTAMMIAMAYVMITEQLHDQSFVDRHVYGFDEFKDYCLGVSDGIKKDPHWAEPITGVPAGIIASLAREYANTKPSCLRAGWAPGRASFGEQFHRAAIALAAITGNVRPPGGSAGVWLPDGFADNPHFGVGSLPKGYNAAGTRLPAYRWADAVLRGKAGGYPSDIKMIYCVAGNRLNQYADVNKGIRALKSVEFTVVHEQFMTPTARYADIVLPAQTHLERNDVQVPHGTGSYLIFSNKAIEPVGECKSDLEICSLLAERLGLQGYNDHSEEAWLRSFVEKAPVGEYDEFRAIGVRKFVSASPRIAFLDQVQDPVSHPFPTPTGKIEILSTLIRRGEESDLLPSIPKYVPPPAEGDDSRYPLLLVSAHSRKRCNSTFANSPWLRELERDDVWINPVDAEARSVRDGDLVRVYNDIGAILLPARVTQRVMPGVVNIYQGAWYDPDEHGNDRGGCVNVLTRGDVSPGGAAVMNGIPVQVERWGIR